MGFYSFYKIIKDIIKTLFCNIFLKIFVITVLFLIFLIIIGETGVFAVSTLNFTYNNHNYTINNIPDNYNYVFIGLNRNNTHFQAYYSKKPLEFDTKSGYLGPLDIDSVNNFYFASILISSANSNNYVIDNTNSTPTLQNSSTYGGLYANSSNYLYSNYDVKVNGSIVHTANDNQLQYINPSLSNTQEQLQNLNFSNFIINANSYTEEIENKDGTLFMLFYNRSLSNSSSTEGLYPIKEKAFTKGSIYTDFENSTSDNMVFSYPIFKTGVFFNIGSTYEIRFAKQVYNSEYNIMTYEYLGEPIQFTISSNVTQDYINQLNQQTATSTDNETTQELQNSIKEQANAINKQTESINDINNSINNSNVENSSIDLPTDNTQDPTQNGVDNIFQTIYNSFTSGSPQDIIFPIPFTDKSITLQPNYIYNMLNNNNASWIITTIQAFWWYLISRFIITDIMRKIRKIKQGNFENLQNSNIKEDML